MSRTLFIGDVHGCREELEELLAACGHGPGDRVALVGDLVAKGPDSAGVVGLARRLGALAVVGNHEQHLLRWRRGERRRPLGPEHVQVTETLHDDDWAYLESLPHFLSLPDLGVVVVHGGLVPDVPLDRQDPSHLVSMRTLRPDGTPSKRRGDGVPWARKWKGPEHVVFGHDAVAGLQEHPFATGLDTGCVYGGALTALVLPQRRLVSVRARRVYTPAIEP